MEMLIVLTIIGLLMAMVIFQVSESGESAKRIKVQADILAFKEMLASYQLDNGTLPTTEQGLKALWVKPTTEPIPQHWHAELDGDETLDPWDHPYQYLNPGKHHPDSYDVFSMGPEGTADSPNVIGNWSDTAPTN